MTAALLMAGSLYKMNNSSKTNLVNLSAPVISQEVLDAFNQWKYTHTKSYSSSTDETYRLNNFAASYNNVNAANANSSFTFKSALNKFSDLSVQEFKAMYLGYKEVERVKNFSSLLGEGVQVNESRDWIAEGAVTPVKDQAACGSCWAFSATGALEGLDFLLNGSLRSFSEQMFLDCETRYPAMGCNGGNSAITMMWTETNGVVTEDRMPYRATSGNTCYWSKYSSIFFNKDMEDVPKDDNEEMIAAIDRQPISIAVAAEKFMHYSSGLFNDWSCGNELDHAILAVGYGKTTGDQMYYKVKNSWGVSWGESGYIRFERRTGKSVGICGLTSAASYPTGQNEKP